jgi:hypothetical protein
MVLSGDLPSAASANADGIAAPNDVAAAAEAPYPRKRGRAFRPVRMLVLE